MRRKITLASGAIVETQSGPDWTLVWNDNLQSTGEEESTMTISDAQHFTAALDDANDLLTFALELEEIDASEHITIRALYMDIEASFVGATLETLRPSVGCIIWYLVVATGEKKWLRVDAVSLSNMLEVVIFPEVPEGEPADDFVEILGATLATVRSQSII